MSLRAAITGYRLTLIAAALLSLISPEQIRAAEAEPAAQRVTLRVDVPPPNAVAPWDIATRRIFDEFVRTHPEIDVTPALGVTVQGTGGAKSLLGIAGGVSPDVFSLFFSRVQSYIGQGFVAPVDGYLDSWARTKEIPQQLWPVVTGADGKRYGAIYTWPTVYLVYRRDLFRQVGLDPDKPPANWDELYEYAQRLSDPDLIVETAKSRRAGLGRMGLFMQTSGSWMFPNFVWQAGGEIIRPRGDGKWEAVFDTDEAVKALEFYQKLRWQEWQRDGKTYTGVVRTGFGAEGAEYAQVFARGEVAMAFMPLRRLQDVLATRIVSPKAIGVAPMPAGPGGIRASIVDGDAYCIASRCLGDRRKMDAAWKYIEFVTGDRARQIETRAYVEAGYAAFVGNPEWLKASGYQEYFDEIPPRQLAAYREALTYGRPEPYCPDYDAMKFEMDIPVSRVLSKADTDARAELEATVKRINTHFLKLRPADEMRFKRKAAFGAAAALGIALLIAAVMIVRSLAARADARNGALATTLRAPRWKHVNAWLFLLPAVGTVLIWQYLPLASGSVMSFYDYRLLGASTFVGLDNFIEAVEQPIFWRALYNTFLYTVLTMALGFVAPIVVALLLSEIPRFRVTFRMLYYLPALTSALVLMFMWKQLFFDPTAAGALNRLLAVFGVAPQTWLNDPRLAMLCVVLPGVWASAGPGSIIYLAALKTVPDEMYEAAEIDGAGLFAKIRLVTIPYMKALIIINFLGAFIGSFHATQQIFVMTMGGPEQATHTLSLEIFFNAFIYLKLGYATAMAWIMGSLLIGFTLMQLRTFRNVEFKAGA